MTTSAALGEIRQYRELLGALRARKAALGLSDAQIDELAGFQSGYTGKLLGPGNSKTIGGQSLGGLLGALGVMIRLVPDPRPKKIFAQRDSVRNASQVRGSILRSLSIEDRVKVSDLISDRQLKCEVFAHNGRRNGSKGGIARRQNLSPARRKQIAQHAIAVRWGHVTSGKPCANSRQAPANGRRRNPSRQSRAKHATR